DVSVQIRDQAMGQGASRVSAIPGVRSALLDMQRIQGSEGGVVLEGRDIGTVVFPDAEAKFFLTASPVVRAERRYQELVDRGQTAELEDIIREVKERDTRDSQRPVAPLKQADDAELVDSSNLDIEEVVIRIVERVRAIEVELGV
ncbi:MAG: (d)CMP kinase, partial [Myxococcales bacterium]|nr:(d)CMP kinase [Myxococcales bacterium]